MGLAGNGAARDPHSLSGVDPLDRGSTSIPVQIAQGNGHLTATDRCRFFDVARRSALERGAAFDVLMAKKRCVPEEVAAGKDRLGSIVWMGGGQLRSNADYRQHKGSFA